MVKLRMMRMGSKKRPYYRVMAIDERKQRDGRPLEFLGTYNPGVEPPALRLELDAIDVWLGKGAQMSGTVRSLVNQVRRSGNTFDNTHTYTPPEKPVAVAAAEEAGLNG
ncbi:MAG: 30S ribosomal protein S16 [Myxococcota bacterium]